VRLFGCEVAPLLGPPVRRRLLAGEAGRYHPPEQAGGRASGWRGARRGLPAAAAAAAADLWAAGALGRALLATQVVEPATERAPGGVAARLNALLASLQCPDPARRPPAEQAGAECRELALRAMGEWEWRRVPPLASGAGQVRYAPPAQRHRAGGGAGQRGVRAGGRAARTPRQTRPVAVARERSDVRLQPASGASAIAGGALPAAGATQRVGSWLALAPSLLAALLSLLLAVTLLLGP
jgi:hypothetical protein